VLTIFLKNHPLTPGYLLAMSCMIPSLSSRSGRAGSCPPRSPRTR
jgi:hypothetical protein